MSEKLIIIAAWGDPKTWDEVTYKPPKIPMEKCRDLWKEGEEPEGEKSKSVTAAIAKHIWKKGRSGEGEKASLEKIVIIVSETLGGCENIEPQHIEGRLDHVREAAKKYISKYVEEFFSFIPKDKRGSLIETMVAPGIGLINIREGEKMERRLFRCNPANYAAYVFSKLLKIFREVKPTTVIVDISHGINYMAHILAVTAEKAFKTYIMMQYAGGSEKETPKTYKILVVNSDPYTRPRVARQTGEGEGQDTLYINVISCEEIEAGGKSYRKILGELVQNIERALKESQKIQEIKVYRFKKGVEAKKIIEKLGLKKYNDYITQEIENFKVIMSALNYGLLLPAIRKISEIMKPEGHDMSKCFEILDEALCYIESREIAESRCMCSDKSEGGGVRVIEVYRKMWLDPEYLSLAVGSCIARSNIQRSLHSGGGQTTDRGTLYDLETLENLLTHIPSEVARTIAEHELRDIKCRAEIVAKLYGEEVIGKVYPYYVIYDAVEKIRDKLGEHGGARLCGNVDVDGIRRMLGNYLENIKSDLKNDHKARCEEMVYRNFYAHAGFEKNATLIKVDRDGERLLIKLGYDKDCQDRIDELVEKTS